MHASLDDTFKVLNFTLPQQIESVTISSKCGPKLWVVESTACGPHVSSRLHWKYGGFLNSRCHLGFQDSWPEKSHAWEILRQSWAGLWECIAFLGIPSAVWICFQLSTEELTGQPCTHFPISHSSLQPVCLDQPGFSPCLPHYIWIIPLLSCVFHLLMTSSGPHPPCLADLQQPLLLSWTSFPFIMDRTTEYFSTHSQRPAHFPCSQLLSEILKGLFGLLLWEEIESLTDRALHVGSKSAA